MEAGVRPYTTTRVQGLTLCPWFPVVLHCGQISPLGTRRGRKQLWFVNLSRRQMF